MWHWRLEYWFWKLSFAITGHFEIYWFYCILLYYCILLLFYCILLYEINAALVSLNTSFQKWQKIKINNKKYWPKTLNCSVCITYLCIFTFNSKSISTMPNPTNFILIKDENVHSHCCIEYVSGHLESHSQTYEHILTYNATYCNIFYSTFVALWSKYIAVCHCEAGKVWNSSALISNNINSVYFHLNTQPVAA